MASLYKRGKTFWISYSENGIRKQRSLKTDNPRVAKHLLKQLEVDLERGISVTPSNVLPRMSRSHIFDAESGKNLTMPEFIKQAGKTE